MLLNQHKQSSLKIHVIFLENLVTKKLHHTEEWTGPLTKLSLQILKNHIEFKVNNYNWTTLVHSVNKPPKLWLPNMNILCSESSTILSRFKELSTNSAQYFSCSYRIWENIMSPFLYCCFFTKFKIFGKDFKKRAVSFP